MPMYSDEIIEEVRSRNDIVDVISTNVQLKKKGSNYFGLCPFHSENSPSFSVNRSKQMFYCFGCHMGGNVYTFLMEYEHCTFPEAVEQLADRCGYKLPERPMSREEKMRQTRRSKLLAINKDAANFYYARLHSKGGGAGMEYFQNKRRLSKEIMNNFALGYADGNSTSLYNYLKSKGHEADIMKESGLIRFDEKRGPSDYFFNRVMFPIVNTRGEPVAFGGRVLDDSKPKYLNSPENSLFLKRKNMFGLNLARKSRREMVILCEGYMDVIALHQAGFDNAIASLGTALTADHVGIIKKLERKAYICYDNDTAGISATLRAIGMFRQAGVETKVITMGEINDPDELIREKGPEAFQERIDQAENSYIFAIKMRQRDFDCTDPEQNNKFLRNMAGRIALLGTEIERESYIGVLADMYHVTADSLRELIKDVSQNKDEMKRISEEVFTGDVAEYASDGDAEYSDEQLAKRNKNVSVKSKSNEGLKETEGIILTWLFEEPELYKAIGKYISIDDFSEGLYRDIAEDMLGALEAGSEFDPAKIMCSFEDNEAHQQIAKMLHTKVAGIENQMEKELLLKETLTKLKQEGMNNLDKSAPGAGKRMRQIMLDIDDIKRSNLL